MIIEETIFFYTRNDYMIINNLLCGNMDRLWKVAEIANNDSKGVLKEHEDGLRTLDKTSIEWYQNRIYDKLDDKAKAKILKTAENDISNILNAMRPTKNKVVLYRNIRISDVLPHYDLNDLIKFKIISSTSTTPCNESYGGGKDFYRYEITLPKGSFALELDQFDSPIRNEAGEVLLPPMKCRVINMRKGDNRNCKGIIELEYIDKYVT